MFGPELEFAMFVNFGFGLSAVGGVDDVIEDAFAYFIDGFSSVDDAPRREIEIVLHALEDRGV